MAKKINHRVAVFSVSSVLSVVFQNLIPEEIKKCRIIVHTS